MKAIVKSGWALTDEDDISWWTICGKECEITLEKRMSHCDRGNWIAKVCSRGSLAMDMDYQDGFPRYYFDEQRAKLEIEAWMKKRGQWVA